MREFNPFKVIENYIHKKAANNRNTGRPYKNKQLAYVILLIVLSPLWYVLAANFWKETFPLPFWVLIFLYLYGVIILNLFVNKQSIFYYTHSLLKPEISIDRINSSKKNILYLRSFLRDRYEWEWESLLFDFFLTQFKGLKAITIGIPEELYEPPSNVSRIYLGKDDNWRQEVANLISKSKYIVIRIDMSAGLMWEIERIITNNEPTKIILFSPPAKKEEEMLAFYSKFRNSTEHLFPKKLPIDCKNLYKSLIITFDKSWNYKINNFPSALKSLNRFGSFFWFPMHDREILFIQLALAIKSFSIFHIIFYAGPIMRLCLLLLILLTVSILLIILLFSAIA